MVEAKKNNGAGISESLVATHCDRLCSLLKALSLQKDTALLELQERVSWDNRNVLTRSSRAKWLHL